MAKANYFADADVLKSLNDNDQVLFRYCDESGNITAEANPNGSMDNIAGICKSKETCLGLCRTLNAQLILCWQMKTDWPFLNQFYQWSKPDGKPGYRYWQYLYKNCCF